MFSFFSIPMLWVHFYVNREFIRAIQAMGTRKLAGLPDFVGWLLALIMMAPIMMVVNLDLFLSKSIGLIDPAKLTALYHRFAEKYQQLVQ